MKPKFDRRTYMTVKACKSPAEMYAFLERIYTIGYQDGVDADVDPTVRYMAIKEGTEYVCGNCGAKLEFEESNND